ncbi:MAG: ompH [Gammaproteobacteria bacterium]|jgi:outer membrane protein|nr:ompH [Gammaproteobacteria bacterium]
MKKLFAIILTGLSLTCFGNVLADDLKVGVIDLHEILDKTPQLKKINDDLKKQFGPQEEKIKKAQQALMDESKKYERDDRIMNESDRKKLQEKIIKDRQELQQMSIDFQQKAAAEQGKAMQKLLEQIQAVIKQVAEKNKLNLVLQKEGVPYFDEKLSVTEQVVKQLAK